MGDLLEVGDLNMRDGNIGHMVTCLPRVNVAEIMHHEGRLEESLFLV